MSKLSLLLVIILYFVSVLLYPDDKVFASGKKKKGSTESTEQSRNDRQGLPGRRVGGGTR